MNFRERALTFDCVGERLVGVLAEPSAPAEVAMLILVGGPQYRVGSHRQFVQLARRTAAAGVAVLRFDTRGMGDAAGAAQTFEHAGADIAAALEALRIECPGARRVVLWGLCDAASSALMYWDESADARIAGMVLVNPWLRSEATNAKTQLLHYYAQRFWAREFWAKLVRGRVNIASALASVAGHLVATTGIRRTVEEGEPPFQERMARGLRSFTGPVLLLLSERDLTAKEFLEYAWSARSWRGLLDRPNVERHDLAGADHTFSEARARLEAENTTVDWLRRTMAPRQS